MVTEIGETLIHEVGHYFGLSEEEIEEIEDRYWDRRQETGAGAQDDERRGRRRATTRMGDEGAEAVRPALPRARLGRHAWSTRSRPSPADQFLEIGPGRGALTLALAPRVGVARRRRNRPRPGAGAGGARSRQRARRRGRLPPDGTRRRCRSAGRRFAWPATCPTTSRRPILFRLLDMAADGARVTDATVMLQREVADRLAAVPGAKDWGVLSACQQLRARVQVVLTLPPGAFRPAPKVHSAVVRARPTTRRGPRLRSPETFDALVRSIFTQRRKMLSNALAPFAGARGLDGGRRARGGRHRRPAPPGDAATSPNWRGWRTFSLQSNFLLCYSFARFFHPPRPSQRPRVRGRHRRQPAALSRRIRCAAPCTRDRCVASAPRVLFAASLAGSIRTNLLPDRRL